MTPLRIHFQLIGMAILWGASWPWECVVAQSIPAFVASSLRFFFAIIPLMIWLYVANRFKYAKQLRANQWVVYTLLARKVLAGIDSLTATTLSSIFGFLLLFMSALCVESTDNWLTVLCTEEEG